MTGTTTFAASNYVMSNAVYGNGGNANWTGGNIVADAVIAYGMPDPGNGWMPAPLNPYTPPQPWAWPPGTTVTPSVIIDELQKQQEGSDDPETLEDTIHATQDQALYDVQMGNITEEQFFEVMKLTFAMIKILPKEEKEEEDDV